MWKIFIKYKIIELQWRIQDFPKPWGGGDWHFFLKTALKKLNRRSARRQLPLELPLK